MERNKKMESYIKNVKDCAQLIIIKVNGGRYYERGGVEDGPTVDILVDEQKRTGFVAVKQVSYLNYLREIVIESFSTTKEGVENFLLENGFIKDKQREGLFINEAQRVEMFLRYINKMKKYWNELDISSGDKVHGMAMTFLSLIDGCDTNFPNGFTLIDNKTQTKISVGHLHEILGNFQ